MKNERLVPMPSSNHPQRMDLRDDTAKYAVEVVETGMGYGGQPGISMPLGSEGKLETTCLMTADVLVPNFLPLKDHACISAHFDRESAAPLTIHGPWKTNS